LISLEAAETARVQEIKSSLRCEPAQAGKVKAQLRRQRDNVSPYPQARLGFFRFKIA
jgi:hypothetical protein